MKLLKLVAVGLLAPMTLYHGLKDTCKVVSMGNNHVPDENETKTAVSRQRFEDHAALKLQDMVASLRRKSRNLSPLETLLQTGRVVSPFPKFVRNKTDVERCVTAECIDREAQSVVASLRLKTFKGQAVWCQQDAPEVNWGNTEALGSKTTGLIMVGNPKASSTTVGASTLRIARHHNCSAVQFGVQHKKASTYRNRDTRRSLVFTTLRDPGARAVSRIFFTHFSLRAKEVPAEHKISEVMLDLLQSEREGMRATNSQGQGGFQFRHLSPFEIPNHMFWNASRPEAVQNKALLIETAKLVLSFYDFILVVERLEESLVALALLMQVDVSHVLSTSSKISGQSYFRCLPIFKSYTPPLVQDYLNSSEWRAQNYGDYLLQRAASYQLDQTIERVIGRDTFDETMAKFRKLKALHEERCPTLQDPPCTSHGKESPEQEKCYVADLGCGYECLDQVVADFNHLENNQTLSRLRQRHPTPIPVE